MNRKTSCPAGILSVSLIVALLLSACTGAPGAASDPGRFVRIANQGSRTDESTALSSSERRRWIAKLARALRGGHGLVASESIQELEALKDDELIARFMADPRFGDTVLDFNLYFLGRKPDRLRANDGSYDKKAFESPSAIAAAQAVVSGGDYFRLLDLEQPMYTAPLTPPYSEKPGEMDLKPRELRQRIIGRIQSDIDAMITLAQQHPTGLRKSLAEGDSSAQSSYFQMGLSDSQAFWILYAHGWHGEFALAIRDPALFEKTDIVAALQQAKEKNSKLFTEIAAFEPESYHPTQVTEIKSLDLPSYGVKETYTPYNLALGRELPNSSTNFDRKRAAYVLSRFFCDDLTPIGVVDPTNHPGDRHASDSSCRSCHYKLDPMAGFFRANGGLFRELTELPFVIFDDNVRVPKEKYFANWKAPDGSGRAWDVGYIRSADRTDKNDYGDTLGDLHRILRTAPEVRSCIVRRMFQYFVADDQAVDGRYLEDLVSGFNARSQKSSSDAFKWAISRIVTSRAFIEPDPVTDECYDRVPGDDPAGAPPCRVAYALKKNCASCHGGEDPDGHLNLERWVATADGTRSFLHFDDDGHPIPRAVTAERIVERLQTADRDRRMPYKKQISSSDREMIYLWAKGGMQ